MNNDILEKLVLLQKIKKTTIIFNIVKTIYLFLILLFSATICGCCSSKVPNGTVDERVDSKHDCTIPTSLSAMARMLQKDLTELGRAVTAADTTLIERYTLISLEDGYYVAAIISLDHTYANGELEKYGVKVQSAQGEILTALIQTGKYLELVESQTVKAIEISQKVLLRNGKNF